MVRSSYTHLLGLFVTMSFTLHCARTDSSTAAASVVPSAEQLFSGIQDTWKDAQFQTYFGQLKGAGASDFQQKLVGSLTGDSKQVALTRAAQASFAIRFRSFSQFVSAEGLQEGHVTLAEVRAVQLDDSSQISPARGLYVATVLAAVGSYSQKRAQSLNLDEAPVQGSGSDVIGSYGSQVMNGAEIRYYNNGDVGYRCAQDVQTSILEPADNGGMTGVNAVKGACSSADGKTGVLASVTTRQGHYGNPSTTTQSGTFKNADKADTPVDPKVTAK